MPGIFQGIYSSHYLTANQPTHYAHNVYEIKYGMQDDKAVL